MLGVPTVLTPLAASGLALTMVGAAVTHLRRGEAPIVAVNPVLLGLAVGGAIERFGPHGLSADGDGIGSPMSSRAAGRLKREGRREGRSLPCRASCC